MDDTELFITGIGVSKRVIGAIVTVAAEKVEGVASVGGNEIASSLVSVFTSKSISPDAAVESCVEDDKLCITVHLAVFYGYPFPELATKVREAIADAISMQVGVGVGRVDVCIDSLVFPKE
jgi:uncharacterized alkaline shock family protein YloU